MLHTQNSKFNMYLQVCDKNVISVTNCSRMFFCLHTRLHTFADKLTTTKLLFSLTNTELIIKSMVNLKDPPHITLESHR